MATKATERPFPARASLYERDFQAWAFEQARLVRERRFAELDTAHLAEEIEDMGREQAHALRSALAQAIAHLMKLKYSPAQEPRRHWEEELTSQREEIESRLQINPGLTSKLPELYAQAWHSARRMALVSLKRDGVTDLPDECPFVPEEVRSFDFWPQPPGASSRRK
jgi:Domain of unknown function DUF29